jgi:hypothetical protein
VLGLNVFLLEGVELFVDGMIMSVEMRLEMLLGLLEMLFELML